MLNLIEKRTLSETEILKLEKDFLTFIREDRPNETVEKTIIKTNQFLAEGINPNFLKASFSAAKQQWETSGKPTVLELQNYQFSGESWNRVIIHAYCPILVALRFPPFLAEEEVTDKGGHLRQIGNRRIAIITTLLKAGADANMERDVDYCGSLALKRDFLIAICLSLTSDKISMGIGDFTPSTFPLRIRILEILIQNGFDPYARRFPVFSVINHDSNNFSFNFMECIEQWRNSMLQFPWAGPHPAVLNLYIDNYVEIIKQQTLSKREASAKYLGAVIKNLDPWMNYDQSILSIIASYINDGLIRDTALLMRDASNLGITLCNGIPSSLQLTSEHNIRIFMTVTGPSSSQNTATAAATATPTTATAVSSVNLEENERNRKQVLEQCELSLQKLAQKHKPPYWNPKTEISSVPTVLIIPIRSPADYNQPVVFDTQPLDTDSLLSALTSLRMSLYSPLVDDEATATALIPTSSVAGSTTATSSAIAKNLLFMAPSAINGTAASGSAVVVPTVVAEPSSENVKGTAKK